MNDNLRNQLNMCYRAMARPARLYDAAVFARDVLGVTREEFARTVQRRPEVYQPVAFLAECDEFWTPTKP